MFNQSDTQHHASSSKNTSNFHDNASTSTSNSNPNRGRQPASSGGGGGSRSPSPPNKGARNQSPFYQRENDTIPALEQPFRGENAKRPASQHVLDCMMGLPYQDDAIDCSEITDKLFDMNKGLGQKLRITPKSRFGDIGVPERIDGTIQSKRYEYHSVYQYDGYIYDPRVAPYAVPRGDYFKLVKIYNPDGFTLEEEYTPSYGGTIYRGVRP